LTEPIHWTTERRRLGDIREWEKNPRKLSRHDAEHLKISLDKFGLADPLIINRDGGLIGGHQRKRLLADPDAIVDVRVPSRQLTEREAEELAIRLNRAQGDWDFDALANGFEIDDLLDWGFEEQELRQGGIDLDSHGPEDPGAQIDRADELREKWQVEAGQLWRLGEHRLICDDCTDREVVERLLRGDKPALMVTDPPYGVKYDSEWRKPYSSGEYVVGKITNDDRSDWSEVYPLFDAPVLYVWHGGIHADIVAAGLRSAGYELRAQIIWNKDVMVFGRGAYHWKHEPCWYAVKRGCKANWIGGRSESTVWDCANNSGAARTGDSADEFNANHISQKPVQLMERAIKNHDADIVADPFLGSGTTLIACERLGRKCLAVEIVPAYVAVTLQRWADMTGQTPELIESVIQAKTDV